MSFTLNIDEHEVSVLNANSTADVVEGMVTGCIRQRQPLSYLPALMLWGPPGVGKSDSVRQAAERIEANTGKKVFITDVRLLLFNPVDLRGIPIADAEKRFAVWLMPRIFNMDASEDTINLLFLDELTAAPQSVQAAAYQITLDRAVGEHHLPDNCVVIAAGNRVTDRSVSYKMPKALANRLCHIEVEADFSAWKEWAVNHDIDPAVIGFLSYDPESLMKFGTVTDEVAFPTPRSWEMTSHCISLFGSVEKAYPLIAGCVGSSTAGEFMTWTKIWHKLPKMSEIFAGKTIEMPVRPDTSYALVSSMLSYAAKPETTIDEIVLSLRTGVRFQPDYAMLLFKGYLKLEGKCANIRSELVRNPDFSRWLSANAKYLNL